jgi:hypothetical protein
MIPLPWLILGVTLLIGSAGATGYWQGAKHKADEIAAQTARDAALVEKARDAMTAAAAESISKIEVRNVTIRQKAETITREVPVYGDCRHDKRMLDSVNEALTGQPPADGKLSAADSAD